MTCRMTESDLFDLVYHCASVCEPMVNEKRDGMDISEEKGWAGIYEANEELETHEIGFNCA